MKRVKAACIQQVLHFMLKEGVEQEYAQKMVEEDVKKYKAKLDRTNTQYKILSEEKEPDGSVIIEIIKQYNQTPVGEFLK